jgi:hypothetical protein
MTQSEPSLHLPLWKHCLGFIPDHMVDKTLSAMKQIMDTVEGETWEHMQDDLIS